MDKIALERLASRIEKAEHVDIYNYDSFPFGHPMMADMPIVGFNMLDWTSCKTNFQGGVEVLADEDCNTCGCIAGHGMDEFKLSSASEVAERLGLTEDVENALFTPHALDMDWQHIEPKHAAKAIRNIINGATKPNEIWRHMPRMSPLGTETR